MFYRILTKNGVDNTNIDGARNYNFNAGRRSGIVQGALNQGNFFASSSNTIVLDTCELRLCGHRVVIDEAKSISFHNRPSVSIRYSLVAQIIVDNDGGVSFDLHAQTSSTALVQDNLDTNGSGTYELEIGRFTQLTDGTITDVVRTADLITGGISDYNGGAINIGNVTTNTLESGMEAEVDVNNRYDSTEKKTYTDFTFGIPKGQDGLNGSGINPNLLINGDFRVNQRGKTSYTGTGYTVDRWRNVGFNNLTVTPLVSGLRLEDTVDAGTGYVLSYKFEDKDYLKLQSKTITISFKVSKNTGSNIYLRLLANSENVGSTNSTSNTGIFSTTITLPNSLNSLELQIRKSSDELNCEIEYVKLELGNVITPFSPRPYAEELTMCQRYFQTINTVTSLLYARTNNQLRTMINFKTEMRTAPTLTQLNTIRVFGINEGTTFTQSSVGISGATATNREGAVVALSNYSGLTEKYIYQFDLGVSTEPIFTADAEIY